MGIFLNNENAEMIKLKIINQACKDYYKWCLPYPEPKKRPVIKGKILTDLQYAEWLYSRNLKRLKNLGEVTTFFRLRFTDLCGIDPDMLMQAIYWKRFHDMPLYDDGEDAERMEQFYEAFKGIIFYEV